MATFNVYKSKCIGRWEASAHPVISMGRGAVEDLGEVFGEIEIFGEWFELEIEGRLVFPPVSRETKGY